MHSSLSYHLLVPEQTDLR